VRFNAETALFEINLPAIEAAVLPEDIEGLMELRIKDLGPSEIKVLQIAACIGSRVTK
jgi:predicted ATPase